MNELEFERQVQTLIDKGYPEASGITRAAFLQYVEPLRERAAGLEDRHVDLAGGKVSFVIVIKGDLVAATQAMTMIERRGRSGLSKMYPREPVDFQPVAGIDLPDSPAYLLVDVDRGADSLNITPNDAAELIARQGRSPLTIEEGIAIVTHYPEFLAKNNCFSLLASRHPEDKRVPAIWINGKQQPNLGWCWAGNPHTWLGSASCGARVSAVPSA